jgi:hypothetical protein
MRWRDDLGGVVTFWALVAAMWLCMYFSTGCAVTYHHQSASSVTTLHVSLLRQGTVEIDTDGGYHTAEYALVLGIENDPISADFGSVLSGIVGAAVGYFGL